MRVTYAQYPNKQFKLQGDDAWNETRFNSLKNSNPAGKTCIVEVKDGREYDKYLAPIGELEIAPENLNY